jgi:hypothetical protein
MSDIDFERLKVLCPLQTRVKGKKLDMIISREMGDLNINERDGVVTRHGFEFQRSARSKNGKGTTWIDVLVVTFFDNPHEWDIRPEHLLYWIDGKWITVEELLKGDAQ